jgi:coenzyme PQQ precursor peptide PqqA
MEAGDAHQFCLMQRKAILISGCSGIVICCSAFKMEVQMAWKAPKIVEVSVGMEINMYACAARK